MNLIIIFCTIIIYFSLQSWQKEQTKKLDDIKGTVDDLYREFQEKFGEE